MRGSLKFETKNFHGVTPLFWDHKPQSKDKKKFSYKSRNMKFPLRGNNAVAPNNESSKVPLNRKPNVNKRDAPVQRPNKTADQHLPATKQRTKEVPFTAKQKRHHPFAETVTLTKAQLDTILASVGKLPNADKNLSNSDEINTIEEQADEIEVADLKPDLAAPNQNGSHIARNGVASMKEGSEQTSIKYRENTTQHREESDFSSLGNIQFHGQANPDGNEARIPVHYVQEKAVNQKTANPYPATQPMSLAERKKRQWQKERAEQLELYDPWGRPGAGAPMFDSKGQVITNYKSYNSQVNDQDGLPGNVSAVIGQQANPLNQSTYPTHSTSAKFEESSYLADTPCQISRAEGMKSLENSSVLPGLSAELTGISSVTQQPFSANHLNPADVDVNKSTRPIGVVPAAMRSSFVIGNNDLPDYKSIRQEEKKKWLMELEKQKEEQMLRKLEEKDKYHSLTESLPFTHAAPSMTQRSDGSVTQKPSHLRGHLNLHMDPVTQQQLELKKRKNEELMLELQAQINQQQKQKQLELEKIQMEEMAEEQRLQAEQQLLNQQYQHEMLKEKQKTEAKEQKLKQLAATIDQAREEAILDKKMKRLQYLEQHGHDTSRLQADLAAACKSVSSCKTKDAEYSASSETNACNQDQPSTDATDGLHNQVPHQSRLRDFASQTESYLLSKCELSDVEIEYESEEETNYEKFPVENIVPNVRPSGIKGKKPIKIQDRPGWGYQNPNAKKPVKKNSYMQRQVTEKKVPIQKTGPLVSTNKREISSKLYSGNGASKDPGYTSRPPKQNSVSQRPRLGGQQEKLSRQFKGGHNQASIKSDMRRGQEIKGMRERLPRDPSPPVPTLRKKATAMKPQVESVTNRGPRGASPPVPAVRRKLQGGRQEIDKGDLDIQTDTYNYDHIRSVNQQSKPVRKTNRYVDNIPLASPVPHNDFIPFTRTSDVLDPANADSPLPISREQSSILRGRQSYWKGQQPADFGDSVEHFIDQPISGHEKPIMKTTLGEASVSEKKALFQQLSVLKQKLRQLELETSTSMLEQQLSP